jgi:hypothetical protein
MRVATVPVAALGVTPRLGRTQLLEQNVAALGFERTLPVEVFLGPHANQYGLAEQQGGASGAASGGARP